MKNILAKLHTVMTEVSYIQKDKTNSGQGYKYASEAAIKEKLHEAFVKNKLWLSFSTKAITVQTVLMDGKNGDRRVSEATVACDWSLYDTESAESVSGTCHGVGHDSGDKAVYKAITGALKYMLTSNFLIETGDDPEEDDKQKIEKTTTTYSKQFSEPPYQEVDYSDVPTGAEDYSSVQGPKTLQEGENCPTCSVGTMKLRKSAKGAFLGCSAFPNCKHTQNI